MTIYDDPDFKELLMNCQREYDYASAIQAAIRNNEKNKWALEKRRIMLEVSSYLIDSFVEVLKERFDFDQDDIDELICEIELKQEREIEDGV